MEENWEKRIVLPKFKEKDLKCVRWDKKNKIEWIDWDLLASLHAILIYWDDIFKYALKKVSRERVNTLKEIRNNVDHHKKVSLEDAYDAVVTMILLAHKIGAKKDDIDRLKNRRQNLDQMKEGKEIEIGPNLGWEQFIENIQLQEEMGDIRYMHGEYDKAIDTYAQIIDKLEDCTGDNSTQK